MTRRDATVSATSVLDSSLSPPITRSIAAFCSQWAVQSCSSVFMPFASCSCYCCCFSFLVWMAWSRSRTTCRSSFTFLRPCKRLNCSCGTVCTLSAGMYHTMCPSVAQNAFCSGQTVMLLRATTQRRQPNLSLPQKKDCFIMPPSPNG